MFFSFFADYLFNDLGDIEKMISVSANGNKSYVNKSGLQVLNCDDNLWGGWGGLGGLWGGQGGRGGIWGGLSYH